MVVERRRDRGRIVARDLTLGDLATWLVDELVERGLTDAVLCPGSRNAPLSFALRGRRRGCGCTPGSTSARPGSSPWGWPGPRAARSRS